MRDLLWPLRVLHGKIHYGKMNLSVRSEGIRMENKSYRVPDAGVDKGSDNEMPIDFVVTWVDGADPEWLEERNRVYNEKYGKTFLRDNGAERYRDWDIFQYWFRAVEEYAPWVRQIHFVTFGHVPPWLNCYAPKLHIVNHEDFIPEKYRPTFNTNAIELNLHRIPGLSEHFVYFNDDVFLDSRVDPEAFFRNGLPVLTAIAEPYICWSNNAYDHMRYATMGLINKAFSGQIRNIMRSAPEKWFADVYAHEQKWNRLSFEADELLGMWTPHLGVPCRKSTLEKLWDHAPEELDATCVNQFRTPRDIIFQIFSIWEMMEGTFYPVGKKHHGKTFWFPPKEIDAISESILSREYRMICINDTEGVSQDEFEALKRILAEPFEKAFPKKSSFEK